MTRKQTAHSLLTEYGKVYKSKYGERCDFNRMKEHWGFFWLLDDYSPAEISEVIEWHISHTRFPSTVTLFTRNFSEIRDSMLKRRADDEVRKKHIEHTRMLKEERDSWRI